MRRSVVFGAGISKKSCRRCSGGVILAAFALFAVFGCGDGGKPVQPPTTPVTVSFSTNGASSGTIPDSITDYYGTSVKLPLQGNIVRDGFSFAGWNTAADGSGVSYSGGDAFTLTGNATLYANWTFCDMVLVKGGTFSMGCTAEQGADCNDNERPVHSSTISKFFISKYQITQEQWSRIMAGTVIANPSLVKGNKLPVESISWLSIDTGFIPRLKKLQPGKNYRLPTEAEWEFAARGGTGSKAETRGRARRPRFHL